MFRERSTKLDEPLPTGWSRHSYQPRRAWEQVSEVEALLTPGGGSYYYTHASDRWTHFWHPIPICGPSASAIFPPIHRYLSCRAQGTTLRRTELKIDDDTNMRQYTVLRDDAGIFLGAMDVHEPNAETAETYDLIAISKGLRGNAHEYGPPGWKDKERPIVGLVCDYFNVLWIEWDDKHEIAYRKGVGWVLKDAWERLELKWIDVTLGQH